MLALMPCPHEQGLLTSLFLGYIESFNTMVLNLPNAVTLENSASCWGEPQP